MFDIGFTELILLAGLGLIVLGPQRLPKLAAQLGRWIGQARRMSRTLMYQLRQEVNLDDPRPFSTRPTAQSPAGAKASTAQAKKGGGAGTAANSNAAGDEEATAGDKDGTAGGKEETAGEVNTSARDKDDTAGGEQETGGGDNPSQGDAAKSGKADGAGVSPSGE